MGKFVTLLLIVVLTLSSLLMVELASAQSIPKPLVPEFNLKYVDRSYDVPPTYGVDQYTGRNVIVYEGYHVDNKSIEFTFKNQPFAPYADSSGNSIRLFYNFRFRGSYGDAWTYYPEDSNGQSVIHYGGGIQVDDTKMYPPMYAASNSDYTVVSLSLILLGPPVSRQAIPDGVVVNFQAQALIGHFDRTENGYYILTGESSDWSNTRSITIGKSDSTTTPDPLPSQNSTATPDQTTGLTTNETSQTLQLETIIGAVITVPLVSIGLLAYFKKRKHKNMLSQTISNKN